MNTKVITILGQKKKMRRFLRLPIMLLIIFSFISLISVVTILEINSTRRTIMKTVNNKLESFSLTLSLQISQNKSITTNEEIISYLQGDGAEESLIRERLSNKVIQSPLLRANTIISLTDDVDHLSSYQISTFPNIEMFKSLTEITRFLNSTADSFFFLRHEVIPYSYDHVPYPSSNGLISLVEKIKANENTVGLLVSDYNTNKLYTEGLSFVFSGVIDTKNMHLQNNESILKEEGSTGTFLNSPKSGLFYKPLNEALYVIDLKFQTVDTTNLTLVLLMNVEKMVTYHIITFIILIVTAGLLLVITELFIRYSSNKIFDPLAKINHDIKTFLE